MGVQVGQTAQLSGKQGEGAFGFDAYGVCSPEKEQKGCRTEKNVQRNDLNVLIFGKSYKNYALNRISPEKPIPQNIKIKLTKTQDRNSDRDKYLRLWPQGEARLSDRCLLETILEASGCGSPLKYCPLFTWGSRARVSNLGAQGIFGYRSHLCTKHKKLSEQKRAVVAVLGCQLD